MPGRPPPRPARSLAVALPLLLAAACTTPTAARPTIEPPPGGLVLLRLEGAPAPCRVEPGALPPASAALASAMAAQLGGGAGDLRDVDVELEGDRPALVLLLGPGEAASSAEPCGWTGPDGATRAPQATLAEALTLFGAGPWPVEIDAGAVRLRSVQRVTRGGTPGGFVEYWIGARRDGGRVLVSRSATLWRRGSDWRPTDSLHVEEADAGGLLVRGRYLRFSDRLDYRLELERIGEGRYRYAGTARGQPIEGTFEAPGSLATALVRVDRFNARAGYGPAGPVTLQAYLPGLDATRPTAVVHERDTARPRGIVTRMGSRVAAGTVDADGLLEVLEEEGEPPTRYQTLVRRGAP
jgi:hypothetical protein